MYIVYKIFINYLYHNLVWKILNILYDINEENQMLVLSSNDEEIYYAISHVEDYMNGQYIKNILILSDNKIAEEIRDDVIRNKQAVKVIIVKPYIKKILINAYKFNPACGISVIDLEMDNNHLSYLVGVNFITVEDLICYCCYRMFTYNCVITYEEYLNGKEI